MDRENERKSCEQRFLALIPELNDYDNLTLERGLSGVTCLRSFVEDEFLNQRHAELFNRVWTAWQRTWNEPSDLEEKATAKDKLVSKLAEATSAVSVLRRAGTTNRVWETGRGGTK